MLLGDINYIICNALFGNFLTALQLECCDAAWVWAVRFLELPATIKSGQEEALLVGRVPVRSLQHAACAAAAWRCNIVPGLICRGRRVGKPIWGIGAAHGMQG